MDHIDINLELELTNVPDMLKSAARRLLIMSRIDLSSVRTALSDAEAEGDSDAIQGISRILGAAEVTAKRAQRAISVLQGEEASRELTTLEFNRIFDGGIDHSDSILPAVVKVAWNRYEGIKRTLHDYEANPPRETDRLAIYRNAVISSIYDEKRQLEQVVQRGLFAYAVLADEV
jgi:hypothetical protein